MGQEALERSKGNMRLEMLEGQRGKQNCIGGAFGCIFFV